MKKLFVYFDSVGRERKSWVVTVDDGPHVEDLVMKALIRGRALLSRDVEFEAVIDGGPGPIFGGARSVGAVEIRTTARGA